MGNGRIYLPLVGVNGRIASAQFWLKKKKKLTCMCGGIDNWSWVNATLALTSATGMMNENIHATLYRKNIWSLPQIFTSLILRTIKLLLRARSWLLSGTLRACRFQARLSQECTFIRFRAWSLDGVNDGSSLPMGSRGLGPRRWLLGWACRWFLNSLRYDLGDMTVESWPACMQIPRIGQWNRSWNQVSRQAKIKQTQSLMTSFQRTPQSSLFWSSSGATIIET